MQCPTCGENTPGTLNGCVRCNAPVIRRPTDTPAQEPSAQIASAPESVGPAQTQRFEPSHEPWGTAQPTEAEHNPRSAAMLAETASKPWTSDPAATERSGGTSPLSSAPEPWSPSTTSTQPWTFDFDAAPDGAESGPAAAPQRALEPPAAPPVAPGPAATASSAADPWYGPPSPSVSQSPAPPALPAPPATGSATTPTWDPAAPAAYQADSWPPPPTTASNSLSPSPDPDARQARTPEPDATQAWTPEPPPGRPQTWPGESAHVAQEEGPAESIFPDSWFAAPRPAVPQDPQHHQPPAAPPIEQWTPGPEPMNRGSWTAQSPPGAVQAWGPEAHNGMAPMPRNETTVLPADYASAQGAAAYPPDRQRRNQASKPLVFAVVGLVVVALLAVASVLWPDGPEKSAAGSSPAAVKPASASDPAARQQATAMNSLLNASAASRGELGRALAAAKKCRGLPGAIRGMQRVAHQRREQLTRAQTLNVNALPSGTQLRAHLIRSIQLSLSVDHAYLTWAQGAQGCKGRPKADANYRRGGQLSAQASVSKQRFAALWAPVAQKQQLPARTATQF